MNPRWLGLALATALTVGTTACKKGGGGGGGGAPRKHEDNTSSLWAFAPADAPGGVVVGDGVPARVLAVAKDVVALVEARPFGKKLAEEARRGMRAPFDLLDAAGWKAAGVDLSRGAAVFGDPAGDGPSLLVLPVTDRAAFRKTVGDGITVEKAGNRELDRTPAGLVCDLVNQRYLCAPTAEAIDAAAKAHASRLAAAVKALPREERGDVELYYDHTLSRGYRQRPDEPDAAFASLRLDPDGATVRGWVKGKLVGVVAGPLAAAKPPQALVQRTADAVSVLRVHANAGALLALAGVPPSLPAGPFDLRRDLLDQLAGDAQIVSSGTSAFGGAAHILVKDGGKVRGVLEQACGLAKAQAAQVPQVTVKVTAKGCEATIPPDVLGGGAVPGIPTLTLRAEVDGDVLALVLGDAGRGKGSAADVAGSPETRDMLAGAWTAVLWARGFDLTAAMPAQLLATMRSSGPAEIYDGFELASWLGAHVYEAGLAVAVENDRIRGVWRLTTFAGDSAEARAAYEAALAKRNQGNDLGFRSALADLEKKHPSSLAARQAKIVRGGAPALGMSAGIAAAVAIPAFVQYTRKSKSTEAVMNVRRLADGARLYHEEHRKLPPAAAATPPPGACCQGPGGKCAPDPTTWAGETWLGLRFSMDDPHYYSYAFEASDTAFTARALGDLDCDGVLSTFEMVGQVEPDGSLRVAGGMYKNNELE